MKSLGFVLSAKGSRSSVSGRRVAGAQLCFNKSPLGLSRGPDERQPDCTAGMKHDWPRAGYC